jgi:hypothetical protein
MTSPRALKAGLAGSEKTARLRALFSIEHSELEFRKEALAMALYVAIVLLAELTAVPEDITEALGTFKIVWGTTLGLAAAHWFAFHLSSRLVASGSVRRQDAEAAVAQLLGALGVALLATVPLALLPASSELDVVRIVLALFLGFVGYAVARAGGVPRLRSFMYSASVLAVALTIAILKNLLAGH